MIIQPKEWQARACDMYAYVLRRKRDKNFILGQNLNDGGKGDSRRIHAADRERKPEEGGHQNTDGDGEAAFRRRPVRQRVGSTALRREDALYPLPEWEGPVILGFRRCHDSPG